MLKTISLLILFFISTSAFAEKWDTIEAVCKKMENKLGMYVGSVEHLSSKGTWTVEPGEPPTNYVAKYGNNITNYEYQTCPNLEEFVRTHLWGGSIDMYSKNNDVYPTGKLCAELYIRRHEFYHDKCVKPVQLAKEQAEARAKIAACLATPSDECTSTIKNCATNPASNAYCNNWGQANENGWLGIKQAYEAKMAQTEAAKAQQLALEQKKAAGWNESASKVLDELKAGKEASSFKEGIEAVELGHLKSNEAAYQASKTHSENLMRKITELAVAQKAAQAASTAVDTSLDEAEKASVDAANAEVAKAPDVGAKKELAKKAETKARAAFEESIEKDAALEEAKLAYQNALASKPGEAGTQEEAKAGSEYPSDLKMATATGIVRGTGAKEQDPEIKKKMKEVEQALGQMAGAVYYMRNPKAAGRQDSQNFRKKRSDH